MAPKDILTKELLQQEFIENKQSVGQIAIKYQIKSKNSVTQALIRHNLSRKPTNRNAINNTDKIIDLYLNHNKSMKEIAKICNVARISIKKILVRNNIQLRTHTKSESFVKMCRNRQTSYTIPATYWSAIRCRAQRMHRDFNITMEEAYQLYLKQNKKCALSGEILKFKEVTQNKNIQTASLDRIDSSKGYTIDNIQWIHKDINRMKMNLSENVFFEWCKKIVQYKEI